ncbi:Y-box-binding protein 2-A-like isoform X2 [Aphelenchoides besseyi]|nr:Y-box-binding protein 2-A-like isoform X2 [Aphelenchoides besseyi]KAI6194547.1 Y-box-binding protein 2-A-like isoform X2 [Aphelenchoides besseyi]
MSDVDAKESAPSVHAIERGIGGRVKWFSIVSGYGFINRRDTNEDVFVHASAIIQCNPRQLHALDADQEVVFDVCGDAKGKRAVAVTGLDGLPVHDTRIIFRRFGRRNNPNKRTGAKNRNSKEINSAGDSKENKGSEKETPTTTDEKATSPKNPAGRRRPMKRNQKKNKKIDGEGESGDQNTDSAAKKEQEVEGIKTDETVESDVNKKEVTA